MVYKIEALTKHKLKSIGVDAPLVSARALMKEHKIRHLPVVDEGQLIGIISDRDILRATTSEILAFEGMKIIETDLDSSFTVRDFLSWPVKTVESNLSIHEVTRRMIKEKISAFLVTEKQDVVGIITTEDLLLYLDSLLSEKEKSIGLYEKLKILSSQSTIAQLLREISNTGI